MYNSDNCFMPKFLPTSFSYRQSLVSTSVARDWKRLYKVHYTLKTATEHEQMLQQFNTLGESMEKQEKEECAECNGERTISLDDTPCHFDLVYTHLLTAGCFAASSCILLFVLLFILLFIPLTNYKQNWEACYSLQPR